VTGSTHEYTATLVVGADEYPLGIRRNGAIRLDEGSAPHVQADLDLALPDEALSLLLDPRTSARVHIAAHAEFATSTQDRAFDLCLRRRPIRRGPGAYASVSLASDEALLGDYAPLEDDDTPFGLASSLRDVVDYVLGEAIPGGATLAAAPDNDADVTARWPLTNLSVKPRIEATTGFRPGVNATGIGLDGSSGAFVGTQYVYWVAGAAGESYIEDTDPIPVSEGSDFTASIRYRSQLANRTMRLIIHWLTADGTFVDDEVGEPIIVQPAPFWGVAVAQGTVPRNRGISKMRLVYSAEAQTPGEAFGLDGILITAGRRLVPYFDGNGSIPADPNYTYAWQNVAGASQSTRTPLVERDPDSLTWPVGVNALDFLHPHVQAAGFRLVCDEQRVWTLRDETYTAAGSLTIREGVNLIDGEDVIDRDSGLWFDAQATIYEWDDRDGIRQRRVDAYALNDPPQLVNTITVNAAYPGPGRSEYAVRRAQGRGREVTATVVSDWRTAAEQPVTIRLEDAPTQTGATSRVEFDLSNDRMTVTTRTTDTPDTAWLLIPEDETWLDQPIGESWIEEVI
jgi:hypothetical protein